MWLLFIGCGSSPPTQSAADEQRVEPIGEPEPDIVDVPDPECLLASIGYTDDFTDRETVESYGESACVRSWNCGDRIGFAADLDECELGGYLRDDQVFATYKTDDAAVSGGCDLLWTGEVVDDCPEPADVHYTAGCLSSPRPLFFMVDGPVSADASLLLQSHSCHGLGVCERDGVQANVVVIPTGGHPNGYVFVDDVAVAALEDDVWTGPDRWLGCLHAELEASSGCVLAP